ncbi:hypothetical protein BATDEDRAFT_34748 [Batrachochytrium dendrobatidis JAM81]|uniref:Uncharacterized protein n=2 Tax=Batrachochytrium dendrobatidis TaxID=109871 RepID=F4NZI4_BATDJ|nr:uncharacterized protein BATDEDRAFT_34748 [Batrachochytrium dendrobatidis JAM81]EGF81134.1 hypothetical protein BATDEDRAFT_34748 [Batrachochytrium dendrobatidis JAM81]|eukprot:XP_006677996.1 hypothetical protein BATDEDRAFT_34748 [Batrachochytrium dendrobatidis JAM81]
MLQSSDNDDDSQIDEQAILETAIEAGAEENRDALQDSSLDQTFFEEKDKFLRYIRTLWSMADKAMADDPLGTVGYVWSAVLENKIYRMMMIIDKYQEMPQLLDPHLEEILTPIISRLLAGIKSFHTHPKAAQILQIQQWRPFFMIICHLAKARGRKIIMNYFTHEVADLEPCIAFLNFLKSDTDLVRHWHARYVLLLWISLIAMIPFDLIRVDSGQKDGRKLVDCMLDLGKSFLDAPGKEHEGASILIMRILSRKDTSQTHLLPFIEEAFESLGNTEDIFKVRGNVATLCCIYKYGPRQLLLETVRHVHSCSRLMSDPRIQQNSLMRKQVVKLAQRIALCAIKPRIASWRYQRGSRSLAENLAATSAGSSVETNQSKMRTEIPCTLKPLDEDDFDEIPDEMEDIINILLDGLRDKDTIVRWTSAKGVGRITNRLNHELADEIVGSVIDSLAEDTILVNGSPRTAKVDSVSDSSWHGASLALAELIRRGLLLPERLKECIPWIMRGLTFEQRKGTHSIGAHVRDAACYVCWSLARAYAPEVLEPYALELAQCLIVTAVTDREVNIRRASAAAFQENVGRHGLFPHGIAIVGIADYFNLGVRAHVYTDIIPTIASFSEYAEPIMNHLVSSLQRHWDKHVRVLAAKSLGILTKTQSDYITETVLPITISRIGSDELELRHASLMSCAEILKTLFMNNGTWSADHLEHFIKPAFMSIESFHPKHTESFGSDLTRTGAAFLMEVLASTDALGSLSKCGIAKFDSVLDTWWTLLDSSIDRSEEQLQENTAKSICCLAESVGLSDAWFKAFTQGLDYTAPPARRRGCALVFGFASLTILSLRIESIIQSLAKATQIHQEQVYNDAGTRRNAVHSITAIIQTYGCKLLTDFPAGCLDLVVSTLLKCTEDYSTDSRGDVGSWVREASVKGISALLPLVASIEAKIGGSASLSKSVIDAATRQKMIAAVVLQSVEKIDRVRSTAGVALHALAWEYPELEFPYQKEVRLVIPQDTDIHWLNPREVYPMMVKMMHVEAYRSFVLLGIVTSIGGLTESLVRSASSSLMEFVLQLPVSLNDSMSPLKLEDVLDAFTDLLKSYQRDDRVSIPILEVLDLLLTSRTLTSVHTMQVVALYNLTKSEVFKSKNVRKLTVGIKVFAGFAGLTGDHGIDEMPEIAAVQKKALKQLMLYLAHPYPKVRRAVSEALYLVVSTGLSGIGISDEALEATEDVLLSTDWDIGSPAELKALRAKVEASLAY